MNSELNSFSTEEASTNLTELIKRAESGESVLLTRQGKPVAKMIPAPNDFPRRSPAEFAEAFRKLADLQGPAVRGSEPLWKLRHEGHKY